MRYITNLGIPLPKGFSAAADFVVNHQLRQALEYPIVDPKRLLGLLRSARLEGVVLDGASLEYAYRQSLEKSAGTLFGEPSLAALEKFHVAAGLLQHLPFAVDLWKVQNLFFQLLPRYRDEQKAAFAGDDSASAWVERFRDLGGLLRVKVPDDSAATRYRA
jgi:hypothetical protein